MATSTYLSSPNVTVNAVSLQDQCQGLTFTRTIEALVAGGFIEQSTVKAPKGAKTKTDTNEE